MLRSGDLTGGLLIACGVGCLATAFAFAGEGPDDLTRSPLTLAIWGGLFVIWGAYFIARTRADGTGALTRAARMLRPFVGLPEAEVRKWLGAPNASCDADDRGRDLTWDAPGYSITLRFRDGVCLSVVREVVRQS